MAAFSITTAVSEATLNVKRQGRVAFTVTNTAGRDLTSRARVVTEGTGRGTWFTLAQAERPSAVDATHQVDVDVSVPLDAAPGTYRFRLDVLGIEDPDEDAGQGPWTTFEVRPIAPPRNVPWRWIGVAAAAVVVIAVLLFVFVLHRTTQLSVAPGTIKFGTVSLGQGSAASVFTVTNTGGAATAVGTSLGGDHPQDFRVVASTCGGSALPAAASCQVQIAFVPTDVGLRTAVLHFRDGGGLSTSDMQLSGTGQNTVVLTFDPPTVALGDTNTAPGLGTVQTKLTISNTGTGSVKITSVKLQDTTGAFKSTSACDNQTLTLGKSCTVTVVFTSTAITTQVLTAQLLVTDDQPGSPQVVQLSGFRGQYLIVRVPQS